MKHCKSHCGSKTIIPSAHVSVSSTLAVLTVVDIAYALDMLLTK